jgi:RHS repeat-associated protein
LKSVSGSNYTPPNWDVINYTSFNKISYVQQGNNSLTLGGAIAILEQSNKNAEKLRYIHKDHLGSIQAYSDENGNIAGELSYDAWGRRRNPDNWQYYANLTDANAWHQRGFTGHEHLDLFEMINMNGRMYDPVLGRFLSADPFVQAPDYTQGLNRYLYCLNNPLSLVDLSGYSWFSKNWKTLVAAAVGITVSVLSAGIGSGIGGVMIAGALGGASSGLAGALLNGANVGQIVKSTITGAFWGAVSGFLANASGGGTLVEKLFKHTFSQTWLEGIRGGNMKHGFISGLVSSAGGAAISKYGSGIGAAGKVAANAVLSGTVAELGGGKFANGAITGAYAMLFNDLMHEITTKTSASVKIKRLLQNAKMNCIPACGEVVSSALGNEVSQDRFRELAGGDPKNDMITDLEFWTETYTSETGHTVDGLSSAKLNVISRLRKTLENGGVAVLTLTADHSVVVESVSTTVDENGSFKSMKIRVMDPAIGNYRSINFNNKSSITQQISKKIYNAFYITK